MANIDFFKTYVLKAIVEEQVPAAGFFRDRYFPTGAADIFKADKVLTEYKDGDRKMAAFVSPRVGDIPVERGGYAIHEYQPAYIAPSRILTLDDLAKRGFGEALFSDFDAQTRAAKIMAKDLVDLDGRIARREEWMAVQTIINNGCTMQEYIDDNTVGDTKVIKFYDGLTSDHIYTIATGHYWGGASGDVYGDVVAMCRKLSRRGLPATDLVLGADAYDGFLGDSRIKDMMDRRVGFNDTVIDEQLTKYDGVTFVGTFNFSGFRLSVFVADETYVDSSNSTQNYFPAKSAMVSAPGCGHTMYGQITQIDYGSTEYSTYAAKRVPKTVIDQDNDTRKLRLGTRPLTAPHNKSPYTYAANVVS